MNVYLTRVVTRIREDGQDTNANFEGRIRSDSALEAHFAESQKSTEVEFSNSSLRRLSMAESLVERLIETVSRSSVSENKL